MGGGTSTGPLDSLEKLTCGECIKMKIHKENPSYSRHTCYMGSSEGIIVTPKDDCHYEQSQPKCMPAGPCQPIKKLPWEQLYPQEHKNQDDSDVQLPISDSALGAILEEED